MNNRDMVDQLYVRLVNAPDGLDCSPPARTDLEAAASLAAIVTSGHAVPRASLRYP